MNENKTNINWYPGHMAKTKRLILENLNLIDVVYEVIDARMPKSSKIIDIDDFIANKKRILIMNKYDLFLDGNHPLVEIENVNVNNDKKLLMIKDSYANSFVEILTPFFSEIVMLDPRYYYDDIEELISEKEFTDIIYLYNSNTFFQDNSLSLVLNN